MKSRKKISSEPDLLIHAKAKMKRIHVYEISKVEVKQFSNCKHEKQHEIFRINVPNDLKNNKTYKDATIGTIRSVSITIE